MSISRRGAFSRVFAGNRLAGAAAIYLVVLVAAVLVDVVISPSYEEPVDLTQAALPPMSDSEGWLPHILGTDQLGRDLFGRLLLAARVSLLVGLFGVLISGTIGISLGVVAGYFRGSVDTFVMRLVDIQMCLPSMLVALLVLFVIGPSLVNVVLVLAVTQWMIYARVARGLVLSLREMPYIEAAKSLGAGRTRIIVSHILPNAATPLLVLATLEMAVILLTEASLSFLGLGIQPPQTSWGLMLAEGQEYMTDAWWLVTFPGLMITFTAISINLIAVAMRRYERSIAPVTLEDLGAAEAPVPGASGPDVRAVVP